MQTYGRYSLLETLGSGSVTESFRAKRLGVEGFEKQLVLKRVHSALGTDSDFVASFLTEAGQSVALSHRGIAPVLDLGSVETEGELSYFLATEHVAGLTLKNIVELLGRRGETLAPEIGLYIAIELSKALDYAHRQQRDGAPNAELGIAHGGISLRNVMLSYEGEVKLTDFRVSGALRRKNIRAGLAVDSGLVDRGATLLSPEELAGAPPSAQGDIFALGALLLRGFLTGTAGEHALGSASLQELIERQALPSLGTLRSDLPPSLSALLARALRVDPRERLATASEAHEALLDLISTKRLRSGRGEVAAWLTRLRPETNAAAPHRSTAQTLTPRFPGTSSVGKARDVSLLALNATDELSLHEQDRIAAIVSRFARQIIWRSPTQAVAVFSEPAGRDAETAVRCGLTLLRALRAQARSVGVAVDLAVERSLGVTKELSGFRSGISEVDQQAALHLTLHAERRIVVTRRTARELRYLFKLKRLGPDTLAVVGARPLDQASGAFVGRANEIAWLFDLFDRHELPSAPALLLGPAGSGKTRLINEFSRRARTGNAPVNVCVAVCPPQGKNIAYSGVVALLGRLCEVREGDSFTQGEQSKRRIAERGIDARDVELILQMLQTAPIPDALHDARLASLLGRYLSARINDVFVLDNAHHLDSESVRVLCKTFADLANEHLCLVLSARSNPLLQLPNPTDPFPRLSTLTLEPLNTSSQKQIICSRLHLDGVPDDLTEFFVTRAQGNPFVLEELLREGVGQGQIVLGLGRLKEFRPHAPVALPRSVRILEASSNGNV